MRTTAQSMRYITSSYIRINEQGNSNSTLFWGSRANSNRQTPCCWRCQWSGWVTEASHVQKCCQWCSGPANRGTNGCGSAPRASWRRRTCPFLGQLPVIFQTAVVQRRETGTLRFVLLTPCCKMPVVGKHKLRERRDKINTS